MSTSFKAKLVRSFAITTLGLAATAQVASADCPGQVFYRLWQPGGAETWYDAGEQIDIASGQEGHIYVHVRGRGDNKYGTSARIGYPSEFGLGGDAHAVERSVKMQAQNGEDRSNGRIRFRADQPGQVQIGYQIEGIQGGSLNNLPGNCRIGPIPINVGGGGGGGGRGNQGRGNEGRGGGRDNGWDRDGGGRGGGRDGGGWDRDGGGRGGGRDGGGGRNPEWQAAKGLVEMLYEGILRREEAGQVDDGYIRLVVNEGQEGLEKVAGSMFKSPEFQQQALRRIESEQGRMRDRDERMTALLWGIYSWLYGESEPNERRADQDYEMLDACFAGNSRSCESLGRSIIANPLFEESNSEYLEALY
jgi:hypothetical protein